MQASQAYWQAYWQASRQAGRRQAGRQSDKIIINKLPPKNSYVVHYLGFQKAYVMAAKDVVCALTNVLYCIL
jgi:hypothetical protein